MVHRVELLQLHGAWADAMEEAERACEWLAMSTSPEGPGDAHYRLAELHRLRGDFTRAEEAYRRASRLGRQPEPGLSLLWLSQGRAGAARTAIRRCLEEAGGDRAKRSELLDAYVEILLELGDAAEARAAAVELGEIAMVLDALVLQAIAGRAEGRVLIAERDGGAALGPLRRSWAAWQKLDAPYEGARNRVLIGIAYRQLGDDESAAMEFDAARWVFEELGATPALRQLDGLLPALPETEASGGLTAREVEVLRLVAAGNTNKEIASVLVISEHTVARHVQNMLSKLNFSSRTSLAAFAVERGLAGQPHGQF